jgi:UDP-glucose 4-epimerase
MRILVTGGAGFIGSHVVDAYVEAGHEVVVLDDLSTGRQANLNAAAEFHRVDLNSPHLDDIFRDRPIDIVNHHAAQVDVRRSVADPVRDASVNIIGTIRLLECCRRSGVRGIVFASTGGAIYGEHGPVPTPEDAPTRPISPYGISKLAGERYVDFYHGVQGMPAVILRYANVYGPRQDPHGEAGVVAIFCQRLLQNEPPVIYGDGEQTRDFIYVRDVADANLRALPWLRDRAADAAGPAIFNVGTGSETSVNALLGRLTALAGHRTTPEHAPPRAGEQRRSAVDPARARALLGWTPTVRLADGLGLTLEWFKKNPRP